MLDPYGTCFEVRRKVIDGQWLDSVQLTLQYDHHGNHCSGFRVENTHCLDPLPDNDIIGAWSPLVSCNPTWRPERAIP
ncbi:unnamed protein product, partial [Mesorhabditis spiculigera]